MWIFCCPAPLVEKDYFFSIDKWNPCQHAMIITKENSMFPSLLTVGHVIKVCCAYQILYSVNKILLWFIVSVRYLSRFKLPTKTFCPSFSNSGITLSLYSVCFFEFERQLGLAYITAGVRKFSVKSQITHIFSFVSFFGLSCMYSALQL